jgi:hypothetical protein
MLPLATPLTAGPQGTQPVTPPAASADDDTIEAGEAEAETPRRQLVRWNEFEVVFNCSCERRGGRNYRVGKPSAQLSASVMAVEVVSSISVLMTKRWPSGDTS